MSTKVSPVYDMISIRNRYSPGSLNWNKLNEEVERIYNQYVSEGGKLSLERLEQTR